ncbi:MAG: hypothetical protein AAGA64_12285 [Bacteroidota bacterium]
MNTLLNIIESGAHKVSIALLQVLICSSVAFAQHINVGKMRDISVSATSTEPYNSKEAFKKVIGMLDLKDSEASVTLCTSLIGAPGIPKVNVATLPEPESSSVLERNKALASFFKKGLADFEYLDQPATHRNTEIFRSVKALTDQFKPGASRTILIIESDFVSSGYVAEFFNYQDSPSSLMDDFDKIISAFKKDSELPDLKGAEVILITPGDSELAVWSVRWWSKAFYLFGASKVSVRATL